MIQDTYISDYCRIKNQQVILNGELLYSDSSGNLKDFLKGVYRKIGMKYSKFFKMDHLCKLGILGSELILNESEENLEEKTALVFSNHSSSLDTDRKFQESFQGEDSFPSPAVFVYTLPNIILGEISIRHQFKGENAFFINSNFDAGFHCAYEKSLFDSGHTDRLLGGWLEVDNENYEAFIYQITTEGSLEHTEQNLLNLYKA